MLAKYQYGYMCISYYHYCKCLGFFKGILCKVPFTGSPSFPMKDLNFVSINYKYFLENLCNFKLLLCYNFNLPYISAWELTVPTMVEGEVCQLITASRFAYGPIGRYCFAG